MDKKKWHLVICIALPLAVGGLAALVSGSGMQTFSQLHQPPLSPPGWLFPVVWSCLYALMGLASWLVCYSGGAREAIQRALTLYAIQLMVNFFWPVFFFRFSLYLFSFFWLVLLMVLVALTAWAFGHLRRNAAWCLAPYLVWIVFAGYLNWGIYLLN